MTLHANALYILLQHLIHSGQAGTSSFLKIYGNGRGELYDSDGRHHTELCAWETMEDGVELMSNLPGVILSQLNACWSAAQTDASRMVDYTSWNHRALMQGLAISWDLNTHRYVFDKGQKKVKYG